MSLSPGISTGTASGGLLLKCDTGCVFWGQTKCFKTKTPKLKLMNICYSLWFCLPTENMGKNETPEARKWLKHQLWKNEFLILSQYCQNMLFIQMLFILYLLLLCKRRLGLAASAHNGSASAQYVPLSPLSPPEAVKDPSGSWWKSGTTVSLRIILFLWHSGDGGPVMKKDLNFLYLW